MGRERRRARPARPARRVAATSGPGSPRRRWPRIAVGAAIAALLAAWLALEWPRRKPPVVATSPVPAPASDAEVTEAYQRGLTLVRERRAVEALPHLARALEGRPDHWQVNGEYGLALANAALETTTLRGRKVGWARSSWERVELVQRAVHHMNVAERSASAPEDLGYLRHQRGRLFRNWGFQWEALFELERAAQADSLWREERLAHLASLGLPPSFEIVR